MYAKESTLLIWFDKPLIKKRNWLIFHSLINTTFTNIIKILSQKKISKTCKMCSKHLVGNIRCRYWNKILTALRHPLLLLQIPPNEKIVLIVLKNIDGISEIVKALRSEPSGRVPMRKLLSILILPRWSSGSWNLRINPPTT